MTIGEKNEQTNSHYFRCSLIFCECECVCVCVCVRMQANQNFHFLSFVIILSSRFQPKRNHTVSLSLFFFVLILISIYQNLFQPRRNHTVFRSWNSNQWIFPSTTSFWQKVNWENVHVWVCVCVCVFYWQIWAQMHKKWKAETNSVCCVVFLFSCGVAPTLTWRSFSIHFFSSTGYLIKVKSNPLQNRSRFFRLSETALVYYEENGGKRISSVPKWVFLQKKKKNKQTKNKQNKQTIKQTNKEKTVCVCVFVCVLWILKRAPNNFLRKGWNRVSWRCGQAQNSAQAEFRYQCQTEDLPCFSSSLQVNETSPNFSFFPKKKNRNRTQQRQKRASFGSTEFSSERAGQFLFKLCVLEFSFSFQLTLLFFLFFIFFPLIFFLFHSGCPHYSSTSRAAPSRTKSWLLRGQ